MQQGGYRVSFTASPAHSTAAQHTVVALGFFDGLHLGHQAVLQQAVALGKGEHFSPWVLSFSQHPKVVLQPALAHSAWALSSVEERLWGFAQQGMAGAVMLPFSAYYRTLSREAFVEEVLLGGLHAKAVVVGYDFHFGHHRLGNAAWLQAVAASYGLQVVVVPPTQQGGSALSSTWVRQVVEEGNVAAASQLLGRPYSVQGQVVQGQQLGRQLGVPTANMAYAPERLLPPVGVYVAHLWVAGQWHPALLNLGFKPTVAAAHGEGLPSLEVHALGYEGPEFYGQHVAVAFHKLLREEQRFETLQALRQQLQEDKHKAQMQLTQHPHWAEALSTVPTPLPTPLLPPLPCLRQPTTP
jgi:riboflavin kinase/FMN adenylyltransferase